MPFRSKAQQKWMFAEHPAMAERWAHETPGIKGLPDKVKKVSETAKKVVRHRKK